MRIVSGALGGRTFDAPRGHRTHPMSDKIRGALFNMLGDIEGLQVADLYSGTGAISFEAISRGASNTIAIEADKVAYATIKKNIDQLNLDLVDTGWTSGELARWLNKKLQQSDVKWEVFLEYLRKVIASLEEVNKIPLATLVRARFLLGKFLLNKINTFRVEAYNNSYQQTLFAPQAKVETSFNFNITFDKHSYVPKNAYSGSYQFNNNRGGIFRNESEVFIIISSDFPDVRQ